MRTTDVKFIIIERNKTSPTRPKLQKHPHKKEMTPSPQKTTNKQTNNNHPHIKEKQTNKNKPKSFWQYPGDNGLKKALDTDTQMAIT